MRPNISSDMRVSWFTLAGAAFCALVVVWIFSDGGDSARNHKKNKVAYESYRGNAAYPLQEEIRKQKESIQRLTENLARIKEETSLVLIPPFVLPAAYKQQKGQHFKKLYDVCVEYLRNRARNKRIELTHDLGFFFPDGRPPAEERAVEELKRLQLSVRAMLLALSTPEHLQKVGITHGEIVETGPVSRPALLREYPFTVTVRGSLTDILWLLHQFSADTVPPDSVKDWNAFVNYSQRHMGIQVAPTRAEDHFPLILRGFSIASDNTEAIDSISQLDAVFELGGMEFLTEEERAASSAKKTGTRGRSNAGRRF